MQAGSREGEGRETLYRFTGEYVRWKSSLECGFCGNCTLKIIEIASIRTEFHVHLIFERLFRGLFRVYASQRIIDS